MRRVFLAGMTALALSTLPVQADPVTRVSTQSVADITTSSSGGGIIVPLLLLLVIIAVTSGSNGYTPPV